MRARPFIIFAAACAAGFAGPCEAQDFRAPTTTLVFMELPLDAASAKERTLNYGMQLFNGNSSRWLRIDQRTLERFRLSLDDSDGGAGAGTWLIAGAAGLLAVAAMSHSGSSGSSQQLGTGQQTPSGGTLPPPTTPGGCPAQC